MKRIAAAAAVLIVASACSATTEPKVTSTQPATTATPAASQPASTAPTTSQAAPPASSKAATGATKQFGQTLTWDKNSEVTIAAPVVAPAPASAQYTNKDAALSEYVTMDVTLKNLSDKPLKPMMVMIQGKSGAKQAANIIDSANGVIPPTADVLPGETAAWKVGMMRAPGETFTVQVQPIGLGTGYYRA